MPRVPPPPLPSEVKANAPTWFDALRAWAEREERGVFGAAGRLLLVCTAVLAVIWFLPK